VRLDKLGEQLKAHNRAERRNGKLARTLMRQQIGERDRRSRPRSKALQRGTEPELVSERIGEPRDQPALPLLHQSGSVGSRCSFPLEAALRARSVASHCDLNRSLHHP
jgi:hypothetical protein